jgi:alpha-galactosidase/6-phospho-beta-glucosidase family protein
MKIAFIGGGSMQWTALLTIDLALTDALAGATLALHDIDAGALGLMARVADQITTQLGRDLPIEATIEPLERSGEQLAGVIAALAGGPAGRFVVNVPNQGQIDNLPRDAVVECMAEIGPLGLRPLAVGALPHPAYAAIAPHVARQELIVEAALTGRRAPAPAALASDPLLRDPADVAPMLDSLLAANAEAGAPLG